MKKISYELTCTANHVTIKDGIATITFDRRIDDDNVETAEASGEYQGNMLWECFDHSFVAYDDDGNQIQYNEEGDKI